MSLFAELKRRHVVQVGIAYLAVAWGMAQVAQLVLDTYETPGWIMQAVLAVLAVSFPVALMLAWVYELRSGRLVKDSGSQAESTSGAAASIVTPAIAHESIAVLPFADMSADKDQEYFSDGMAEELLNLLTKVPGLRVAARMSSFSFKGTNTRVARIGEELRVAHVLDGAVRKAGTTIRITVQLIRADTGYHLWSETWDRSVEDIFAVQDEIAAKVVAQLKVSLLAPLPTVEERNPEAYALYLQGRHLGRQHTAEGFEQSNALFEKALALVPDYAAPWEGLAHNYSRQAGFGLRPAAEGLRLAGEAAAKALTLDPDSAQTHATLGWIAKDAQDLAAAAKHYRKAISLAPGDPDILRHGAGLALALGRLDLATTVQEYVAMRDPMNPVIHVNLGTSYLYARRWEDAIRSYRRALHLSPQRIAARYSVAICLILNGNADAALEEIHQEQSEAYRLIGLAMACHALGRTTESDEALAHLIEKYSDDAAFNIAYVLAFRHETDRVFQWLERAMKRHDPGLAEIVGYPLFANVECDPRWEPFLAEIGKSKAQLDAIEFDMRLP